MKQAGDEMIRLQCVSALLLDSGGSSTMVMRKGDEWPVVNQPSDSHGISDNVPAERPVANALGIVIDKH
jgi:exopolysaccharide biosynthesis protein